VIWLVLLSSEVFATGYEPERPKFDNKQLNRLTSRAAYSAFIGDACNIPHSIPEKVRKIINVVYSTTEKQQRQMSRYLKKKSDFASDAKTIGIWKRCYFDAGKTRVLVSDVGQELDIFYQTTSSKLSSWESEHSQWKYQSEKEERAEKGLAIAESLGKLVVYKLYNEEARKVEVTLLEQEYSENESTYKLKVKITWDNNGATVPRIFWHESVIGTITAVLDSSERWELEKNYNWNQQESSY
jgi:leucyl aminopeptidase